MTTTTYMTLASGILLDIDQEHNGTVTIKVQRGNINRPEWIVLQLTAAQAQDLAQAVYAPFDFLVQAIKKGPSVPQEKPVDPF